MTMQRSDDRLPLSKSVAFGFRGEDGRFDPDGSGPMWMVFEEPDDLVYWSPISNVISTWEGCAFALGETAINDAATYAMGERLHIHSTVGRWIKAEGQGIFVFDWSQAFERLRFCPRIRVDEGVIDQYERHMVPAMMPNVVVRAKKRAALHAA